MALQPKKITAILLSGSDWIDVKAGTFSVVPFDFQDEADPMPVHRGGAAFTASTEDGEVSGPMSSLVAVRSGDSKPTVTRKGRPPKNSTI